METQIEAGPTGRFNEDGLDCSMEASQLTGGLPLSIDDGDPCMIDLEPTRGRIGVCRAAVQIREGMSCDARP